MGGGNKQAQRVKNNARPSSSSRSAELLSHQNKDVRFIPATLSLLRNDELDTALSSDFQLVFKKLHKKDSTTKLKALQELAELIAAADVAAVKSTVGVWASLYPLLVSDPDHRIREAVHNTQLLIVDKDKKLIAPHLKQIIGAWFTSQYDTYPPAASAAARTFHAAFPAQKYQDCLAFCHKEILHYIRDNLSVSFDEKEQEVDAKCERITVACLQGLALFIQLLGDDQLEKYAPSIGEIVNDARFFKMSSHSRSAAVRAAWFKLVGVVYQKGGVVASDVTSHVVPIVMASLDEAEPSVVANVWETVVLIMNSSQEWWKHVNFEKSFLAKLKKVLREGCLGNANAICPAILTFFHYLPTPIPVDSFAEAIFDSMRIGLRKKSVQASQSESGAITSAFMECLEYVLVKKIDAHNQDLAVKLLKNQLFPLLEHSLLESDANCKQLYNRVALLVTTWYRNNGASPYPVYRDLFWSQLAELFKTIDHGANSNATDKQLLLLHSLKNNGASKQGRVMFSEKTSDCVESTVKTSAEHSLPVYMSNLLDLTYVTVRSYVVAIETHRLKELQRPLHATVQLFDSGDFFAGLARHCFDTAHLIDIYDRVLYDWIKSAEMRSEITVGLAFLLFKHLNDEEKRRMLDSFLEFSEAECFDWFVQNALVHPYYLDPIVRNWFKQKAIGDFIIKVAEENLQGDCGFQRKVLLKAAMNESEDGELLLDTEVILAIIARLKTALETCEATSIEPCLQLASFVSTVVYTDTSKLTYGLDLLLSMFHFSTFRTVEADSVTEDSLLELSTSWEDVIASLAKSLERNEFMENVAEILCKFTMIHFTKVDFVDWQKVSQSLSNFLKVVFMHQPMWIGDVYTVICQNRFRDCQRYLLTLCTNAEYLAGNCQYYNDVSLTRMTEVDIYKCFQWVAVETALMTSSFREDDDDEDSDGEETSDGDIIAHVIDDNIGVVLQLFYKQMLCELFLENYKMTQFYNKISELLTRIKAGCESLAEILKQDETSEMLKKLAASSDSRLVWYHVMRYYYVTLLGQRPRDVYLRFSGDFDADLFGLFAHDLTFDEVRFTGTLSNDVVLLRHLLASDEIDVQIAQIVQKARQLRVDCPQKFLFDSVSIDDDIIGIVRLFSALLEHKHACLTDNQWDFAIISLCSWTSNCLKHRSNHADSIRTRAMLLAVCRFYTTVNELVLQQKLGAHFKDEWNDILLPDIHNDLLQIWLYLAEFYAAKSAVELTLEHVNFLHSEHFDALPRNFHTKFIFRQRGESGGNLMSWSKMVKRCLQLFTNHAAVLQLWGYKMLLTLAPGLVEIDAKWNESSTPNTRGLTFVMFKDVLEMMHTMVEAILHGFRVSEDSCTVAAFTDSYTYVFGYLLIWSVLLSMCEHSPPELRYQYADILRNDVYFKSLLDNIFKLVPGDLVRQSELKRKHIGRLFLEEPTFTLQAPSTSERIEHIVCWLYTRSLSQLPALVRQWWTEIDTKASQFVDKITSLYVSQHLCRQELQDIANNRDDNFKNMTIKVIPSVREVVAIYTVDEAQMELVISLPANYPLGGPQVRCSRQIVGVLHKQWLMQLKKYLLHQNGRIWDGLSLWNANLDKKFDGVEECYICFAILHPGTYEMPKQSCQTCKKKFHSACLYKWFSTSNKNSCPICRNLF